MSGQITRKAIIEDEALKWGSEYAKTVNEAIGKNDEFVKSLVLIMEANKKLRGTISTKDYINAQVKLNEVTNNTFGIWKEQIQLENALISTKNKNILATEGTNRALVKERILLAETNKEIKLQTREQLGLIGSYERLNKSRLDSQKRLAELLSAEKKNTTEIAKATIEFEKLDARVKAVDAAIKNYSKNIGNYQSAFTGLNNTAKDLLSTFGVVTGLALFGTIVKDIFNVVKDFDRQLIAVGKTTNMSKDDLKEFGREVVELGGKLDGISITGLLNSAEVAGQLGVTGTENILKFSSSIEKLKLTSDIISDEQIGQFAKFIEVSSDSFDNADRLASVITRLGNELATTEAEVLANATEIQKGVAVWNTAASSILGLGAATSTLGSEAETSRSAVQSTFKVIDNAIATGANLEKILKLTGLTQKELSKQFNQDATGVFVKFVGGLKKAKDEGENLNRVLTSVDITEKRAFTVIGSLAANYGVLEAAMVSANSEYTENAALNKEVLAASESVSSIITDIKDKWEQYILTTNDANGGTESLAKGLKFLRDNLQTIITTIVKYGTILLVFLGVQKAVNFVTATWTALQTAATAAQIRFALATGIGTEKILVQAAALRTATAAQEGMNVAMTATPWGIILAAIAAAVVAYQIFNDELSETEFRVNAVKRATDNLQKTEKIYNSDRDKNREESFKKIEEEIQLKKAQGQNSDALDEKEIDSKKKVVLSQIQVYNDLKEVEIARTKNLILESNKRVEQAQIEFDNVNKFALTNPFGESVKDKEKKLIDIKTENDVLRAYLKENSKISIDENVKLNKILADLDKNKNVKDAEMQAEIDKKALAAARKRAKELYDIAKKLADDEFKLRQFRMQVAIDMDNEILENEKANLEDRIDALLEYQQLYESKIRDIAERELQLLGKYNDEKMRFERELTDAQIAEILRTGKISENATAAQKLIFETYQNSLTNVLKKGVKDRQKLIDGQVDALKKSSDAELQDKETAMNKELEFQNKLLKAALDVGEANKKNLETDYTKAKTSGSSNLMAEAFDALEANNRLMEQATESHEKKVFDIKKKYSIQGLDLQINAIQLLLDNNAKLPIEEQLSSEKIKEIQNSLSKFKLEKSDLELQKYAGTAEERVNLEKEFNERVKDLAFQLKDELVNFANAIFSAKIANIDAEIRANDDYYNRQIELAGNDTRQKDLLEKEREKKRLELEKKKRKSEYDAAVFNKIISLATIATQTAMASIAALAPPPIGLGPLLGGSLLPFIIGLGAVQAATVIATPLPKQYKDGRKGGPAEVAIVGDGGRSEIITSSDGSNPVKTPNVPTYTYLKAGDIVHKSEDDYQRYLRASMIQEYNKSANQAKVYHSVVNDNLYSKDILDELRRNTHAIQKQKFPTQNNSDSADFNYQMFRMNNIKWHN